MSELNTLITVMCEVRDELKKIRRELERQQGIYLAHRAEDLARAEEERAEENVLDEALMKIVRKP